jgi:hypothetical protein
MKFHISVLVLIITFYFAFACHLCGRGDTNRKLLTLGRKFDALSLEVRRSIRMDCNLECRWSFYHGNVDALRDCVLASGEKRIIEEYKRLSFFEKVKRPMRGPTW